MSRCPSCAAEVPTSSRFCASCGATLSPPTPGSEAATVAFPQKSALVSSATLDEGRFPAGTLLADRYRVIGLLGRGGMGEVYRANDLTLGQPVALKFLPETMARNESLLERFRSEVRIARHVSHPNVCRVYDIGQIDGATYLSMEYVDGEDLGSLLRRIGRLPGDKAIEMARKLCAGLAAAHDKGVLHRDLKPANIMIDGRGNVLIMDFGLAGLAGQITGGEIRSGTPAYMAPEQREGKEVTVRSDIYALGLVLHEMFTGRHAFDDPLRRSVPSAASSIVKDIDPAVERVILRCLAEDPRQRPPSALAVAAALPGGDMLAAALAAGETPSPEMVAAAGETGGISVRTAVICLALVLVGLAAAVLFGGRLNILQKIPFENSTEALAQKGRDLLKSLGYSQRPVDRAYGFDYNGNFQDYGEHHEKPADYRAQLAAGQPAILSFWYRESPQYLEGLNGEGAVTPIDPPPVNAGMAMVSLDPQGRLLYLAAVPPEIERQPEPSAPPDWQALFTAAGLDPARFTPTTPNWVPLAAFDARAAWTGSLPHAANVPLRVEAALWRGKPVYFQVSGPWSKPEREQPPQPAGGILAVIWVFVSLLFLLLVFAVLLAWRNYRGERGDLRGATRLTSFVFAAVMLGWLCGAHHSPTFGEFNRFLRSVGSGLLGAGIFGVFYMALEPYVRRRWPQSLITWTRLLAGGVRDPLVAGQALIGVALGVVFTLLFFAGTRLTQPIGHLVRLDSLVSTGSLIATFLSALLNPILLTMGSLFIFFLLRVMFRREWLAGVVFVLVVIVPSSLDGGAHVSGIALAAIHGALIIVVLIRFGLLPLIVGNFVAAMLYEDFPLTTDFSAWYAYSAIIAIAVVVLLAGYCFHTALAGRKVFQEGLLDR